MFGYEREFFEYYIIFPEGEKQQVSAPLDFGDIVDINGIRYKKEQLSPRQIAYQVTGMKKEHNFKETTIFYKLELLNRDEVMAKKFDPDFDKNKKTPPINDWFTDFRKTYLKNFTRGTKK
ncbi:MAG: hypothetical protein A2086_16675 [Spirochaetes bacterium GWD1_27_9]|nr:MAG: hypothetical protein A2086_16675 [Spirochaetes bacterium GWD1_27_9]